MITDVAISYANGHPTDFRIAAKAAIAFVAATAAVGCRHRVVDARNSVIRSGYFCLDCRALFSAADHDGLKQSNFDRGSAEAWMLRAQVSLRDGQPQVARVQIEKALQFLQIEQSAKEPQ